LEPLTVGVLASPEYFARHGGAVQQWVTSLYADILGRTPNTAELNFWGARINAGANRATVAEGFLHSHEAHAVTVTDAYRVFLDREPEQAGLNSWTAALDSGMSTEQLVAQMMNSAEVAKLADEALFPPSLARTDSNLASGRPPAIRPISAIFWDPPPKKRPLSAQFSTSSGGGFVPPDIPPMDDGCGCGCGCSDGGGLIKSEAGVLQPQPPSFQQLFARPCPLCQWRRQGLD
jgi:hypothetical protein